MEHETAQSAPAVVAALEHLTGPSRGTTNWLEGPSLDVCLTPGRRIQLCAAGPVEPQHRIARLRRAGNSYEIESTGGMKLWVNGVQTGARLLAHHDMIEFGEAGPLSRFRVFGDSIPRRKPISDIFADCIDYLRVSRRPLGRRIATALTELARELAVETTLLFRFTVLASLMGFAVLGYQQYLLNIGLRESIAVGALRMESISAAVNRANEEALRPGDLSALRDELAQRVSASVARLEALEERAEASARVIAGSMASVVFLQGSYAFRDPESGLMLRHVVTTEGVPLVSPRGQPLLSLDGSGPVAEINFIGTGFILGDSGALVTNRHVALPWEDESGPAILSLQSLEPVITRFIGYVPGEVEPFTVELLSASDSSDLAILKREGGPADIPSLRLAAEVPTAGVEVIVLGYPTGLRSMLAQSGEAFVRELQEDEDTGFWSVAARLAQSGHIAPLASRGIVGHATAEVIVYDAETTHGGSGGPVLNMAGEVVAMNSAILPEYGGSNLGVPAAKLRAFLDEAGMR
ncbi:MAG TPA: serine protease [Thermohalobaculum sp.]|nr:serine protease [Thermohalobaculum sp.]